MQLTEICASAIYLAAERNQLPMIKLLVKYGANPSAPHLVRYAKCCSIYQDDHPHLELEPLYACFSNDNFRTMKVILDASPSMPYSVLATLRDLLFRTNLIRDTRLRPEVVQKYAEFFLGILSKPRGLQQECRGIIRQCLGNCPANKVDQLPLPSKLKDSVLLKDSITD